VENCLHTGREITVSSPNDVTSCVGCHGPSGIAATGNYHHGD
jgi:hypothetical protein